MVASGGLGNASGATWGPWEVMWGTKEITEAVVKPERPTIACMDHHQDLYSVAFPAIITLDSNNLCCRKLSERFDCFALALVVALPFQCSNC